MVQVHTCVSVRCDQCGDPLGDPAYPGTPAHHPSEEAAHAAALAAGWWVIDAGRRWWCSCCGPVLVCEDQGHVFTPWRAGTTLTDQGSGLTVGGYRYCRRCCLHETTHALLLEPDATEEVA